MSLLWEPPLTLFKYTHQPLILNEIEILSDKNTNYMVMCVAVRRRDDFVGSSPAKSNTKYREIAPIICRNRIQWNSIIMHTHTVVTAQLDDINKTKLKTNTQFRRTYICRVFSRFSGKFLFSLPKKINDVFCLYFRGMYQQHSLWWLCGHFK